MLRNSYFMYLLICGGLFCLFALVTKRITQEDETQFVFVLSLAMIGIIFAPCFMFFKIRSQSKQDYIKKKDIIEVFEITKEKIQRSVVGVATKVTLNWLKIAKVIEVNDAFYFFTVNDESFTITKTGLIEGNLESFRQLIYSYLKKDKKGRVPFKVKDKEQKKIIKEQKKALKIGK